MKEKSEDHELKGTEEARNVAKESGRGLKKGDENSSESSRKEMKQYRTMPRRKTRKIDSKTNGTSQNNSCDEINVRPCKDSRTIHQVSHKRNQMWFISVFREITKQ